MRILWDNKAISATLSTAGEDTDYPATNMQDRRLSRYYKSLTDVDQEVIIDLDAPIAVSYFAIFNHNISSSATIKLQGANEDTNDVVDWDNPDFETTVTHSAYYLIKSITEQTYDRWRFYVDDPLNSDGYIKIGLIYIGTYLQMPGMKIDQEIPKAVTSTRKLGYGGQVYGDKNYVYRNPKINHPFLTNDQKTNINTMFEEVQNFKPVILLIWANDLDFESPIYCVIDQPQIIFKRTDSHNLKWQTQIKYREVY